MRLGLLGLGIAVGLLFILPWIAVQVYSSDYLGDYQVFWTVASTAIHRLYGELHFPYPPSALVLIRPFGVLPFWWAYAAWVVAGITAMVFAARLMVSRKAITLGLLLSYAGIGALVGGQTSLFVGALIIAGVSTNRPALSGVLLGVAAVIKPQSLLAAPIALLASRNYKGIGWAALASGLQLMLTLLLWGPELWVRWATNIHHFPAYLQGRGLDQQDKGLFGLLLQLGLPGWLYVVAIPLGVMLVWKVFRSEAGPLDRYAAFATGTILMSPYTLGYDLAGLSIAAIGLLLDRRRNVLVWVGAAFILTSAWANIGAIMLAIALIRQWWRPDGGDGATGDLIPKGSSG